MLLHQQNVFAASQLLLPSLDLLLARECVCLHNAINNRRKLFTSLVKFGIAFETLDSKSCFVAVFVGFSSDGKLGHLQRGLVSDDSLSCSTDVEGDRMALEDIVKLVVQSVARTTAVEALKADIEASWIVLSTVT